MSRPRLGLARQSRLRSWRWRVSIEWSSVDPDPWVPWMTTRQGVGFTVRAVTERAARRRALRVALCDHDGIPTAVVVRLLGES